MVVPLYKADDPSLINNYRPVSVLPCLSKIFEKIMYNRLLEFIDHCNLLYDYQFGFRKGRSTTMAMSHIINKIMQALDKGEFAIGVFLDFSKAFDTVNFDILFRKLDKYGVRGTALEWFKSYLHNRKQYVKYEGSKSSELIIKCGVPQGSILGPLLFLLYINDIENASNEIFLMLFADDSSAFMQGKDLSEMFLSMNAELKKMSLWLQTNKLSINIGKTHFMVFTVRNKKVFRPLIPLTINGEVLEETSCIKFLGVRIDSKLNWNLHIQYIKSKIAKGVGIIGKARRFLADETLITLYYAFLYPYLQYCIEIWGNTFDTYLDSILKLQKRAVRTISYANPRAHSEPLFKNLEILPVKQVYVFKIAQFMYKYCNNMLPANFNSMFSASSYSYNLRTKKVLKSEKHRLVVRSRFMSCTGVKIWNYFCEKMPPALSIQIEVSADGKRSVTEIPKKIMSINIFKRVLKEHLNSNRYKL